MYIGDSILLRGQTQVATQFNLLKIVTSGLSLLDPFIKNHR